jgi:hypothetical protein
MVGTTLGDQPFVSGSNVNFCQAQKALGNAA